MIHNLYLYVTVVLRTTAIYLMLWGTYQMVASSIVGLIATGSGAESLLAPASFALIPVLAGLVVWKLAKPMARVITRGLE